MLDVRPPASRAGGGGGGGIAARRAVVRWSWRLFRREWRQQIVVLALVTFTAAAALFAAIAAYNMVPSRDAEFGTADHRITVTSPDPARTNAEVALLADQFGPIEVIGHTAVPIPGSVDTVDLRTQEPQGLYSAPMLALRSGRYPAAPGEVAVTDAVATMFRLHLGDRSSFTGESVTVVGIVENPADLNDEFILGPPSGGPPGTSTATVLVRGHDEELGHRAGGVLQLRVRDDQVVVQSESRGNDESATAALLILALDTVFMLLVSLVAAAAFVVVAQRRLRQLGMLAAMGATDRHLRLVMVAHGLAVGIVAAVAGNGIALVGWVVSGSRLETAAQHRMNALDIPWLVLAGATLLTLFTTTAAAWWPARAVARIPITQALTGRPPRPKRVHRSAIAAVVFLAAGFAALAIGIDSKGNANAFAVIVGLIVVVIGVLFLCPIAIRGLAVTAPRLPLAARLAVRDLGRYQARAGAALAAISLGLGIAFATIIVATASAPSSTGGIVSDRQLVIRMSESEVVPELSAAQRDLLEADVARFAATLDGAVVYPLDAAVAAGNNVTTTGKGAGVDSPGRPGTQAIILGVRITNGIRGSALLYVATPQLLDRFGVDVDDVDPSVEVLTSETGDLVLLNLSEESREKSVLTPKIQTIPKTGYSDVPNSFITEAALRAHGWTAMRTGWFIESSHPLTAEQRTEARDLAARSGFVVFARDPQTGLTMTRNTATVAGMLLALAILAMTVGLIRSEAARDLQTLTATGATSITRRTLTAVTAAALALLGALLGLIGAYVALIAGYLDDLRPLGQIAVLHLTIIVVGLPVIAGVAGWLLAGREPKTLTRPID